MIQLTEHAKLRCVQRVFGIDNEHEAERYLHNNEESVCVVLWDMFSKAKLLCENYELKNDNKFQNYYMYEKYILITNHPNTKIITIYDITYDISSIEDAMVIGRYTKKMRQNIDYLNQVESKRRKAMNQKMKLGHTLHFLNEQVKAIRSQLDEVDYEIEESINNREKLLANNKKMMNIILEGVSEKVVQ